MALSNDFEARRRARLKEQRRKRERMNKIKRIAFIILCLLILIILITNIAKCGSKKKSAPAETAAVTEVTEAPSAEPDAQDITGIPAPKEGDNNFLDVLKNSGQEKKVYLTFEEGPDKTVTPEILDVLRRYNVKATFFLIGKNIESDSYLCTRIMEEGHLALPLSYSGNSDTLYASKADFIDEIDKTYDLICDSAPISSKPFKIYRFPGGSTSGRVTQAYIDALADDGYYYCDWNSSVGDSDKNRTADQLNTYFTTNMPQLNNLVVQLHNTSDNEATAQMLGTMIKKLLDDGYSFNRLDEVDFSNASDEYIDEISSTDSPDAAETADTSSTASPAATASAKAPAAPAATKAPSVRATTPPSTGGTGSSNRSTGSSSVSGSSSSGSGSAASGSSASGSSGTAAKGVIETE